MSAMKPSVKAPVCASGAAASSSQLRVRVAIERLRRGRARSPGS